MTKLYVFLGTAESGPARGAPLGRTRDRRGAGRPGQARRPVTGSYRCPCGLHGRRGVTDIRVDQRQFPALTGFFELAREMPAGRSAPPLHALNIADLLRHTRLSDGDRLADCFTAFNQIFQTIRNDPEAALFGFDQYGHVYIHETTHHSIRGLWEHLFATDQHAASRPAPFGMTLPHVGPSEDIAGHAPAYPLPPNL